MYLHKEKAFFLQNWMERGIWSVQHLTADRGNILDYDEFRCKNNLTCTSREYHDVIRAIPQAFISTVKRSLLYTMTIPRTYPLFIEDCLFLDKRCNNKFLRSALVKEFFPVPLKRRFIMDSFSVKNVKRVRCG